MFKLITTLPSLWVTISVPMQMTATDFVHAPITLAIKQHNEAEFEALLTRLQEGTLTDRQLASELVTDWADVADASGIPLPFSPDAAAKLMTVPRLPSLIVRKFFDLRKEDGAAKNAPIAPAA